VQIGGDRQEKLRSGATSKYGHCPGIVRQGATRGKNPPFRGMVIAFLLQAVQREFQAAKVQAFLVIIDEPRAHLFLMDDVDIALRLLAVQFKERFEG